jgi:TP901 family phage tail tape measure protein|nr:MAG TPA_asm: minor tail protein [Bacteriophage sp.]
MWKTVSARIRGAKTELKDMGEDTDGMVESTSKLQALVKGMTGVDILESDGKTFKDIYTIVSGIADKWSSLKDIDRAALLEKLAGKNQSNALAAALSQPEILKKAYEEATNAEGSARKENEEYSKSIQASVDLAKAKLEELANDTLNSNFLKGAIDAGGKLIDILDSIVKSGNAIPAVATAITAAFSFKNVGRDKMYSLTVLNMPTTYIIYYGYIGLKYVSREIHGDK